MHLVDKVYNSRNTLREQLSNEWNIEPIIDISTKELEVLYSTKNDNSILDSGCNMTLQHLHIPSHTLHIIYYNFPELHRTGTKVNKTCADKLTAMYKKEGFENEDAIFNPEDSLLIVINEPISESIQKSIESMYLKGQNELLVTGISDDIQSNMKSSKFEMEQSYFRNVHIFHIDTLVVNLLEHSLVPQHEVIRDKDEIQEIYEQTNSNAHLLPIILRTDPIAKLLRLAPGNICKITRMTQSCGSTIYYRTCK
jgi:DNA-directed RNA polymerase subunit H (RpoH/RPB5)